MHVKNSLNIKNIFSDDDEIYLYCDPDIIKDKLNIDYNDIADKIFNKIYDVLLDNPKSYIFYNDKNRYFAVWVEAHDRNILFSFGVHPEERNPENLINFWKYLSNEHDSFDCYVYSNNTRAYNWLKKCGMREDGTIVERKDKIAKKLVFDKKSV
jgi:hypothetical protein